MAICGTGIALPLSLESVVALAYQVLTKANMTTVIFSRYSDESMTFLRGVSSSFEVISLMRCEKRPTIWVR